MRAKTLILTAVLGAASVAAAVAQTVYSVNAVGFVNKTVPAGGFALLANPLNLPTNSLAAVLPDVPANTKVYKFDGANFVIFTKRATGWTPAEAAAATLNPGEGFFVQNAGAAALNITFVGEVPQGTLSTAFPAGFSLIASKVPQAGTIQTALGLPAATNDKAYLFVDGNYKIYTRRATGWTGGTGEPEVGVAEGFFFQAVAGGTWTRTFSVNE